jgi:hypothetical protein
MDFLDMTFIASTGKIGEGGDLPDLMTNRGMAV